MGYTFIDIGIGMYKKNVKSKIDNISIKNEIEYVIKQYKSNNNKCGLFFQFTPEAIKQFKTLSSRGITTNKDGTTTQKEIGGNLVVSKIMNIEGRIVYIMDIDNDSLNTGVEEEVELESTRFNFHSHPKEAYKRHGVHNGWPSYHDFIGFLELDDTIFHCETHERSHIH